MRFSLLLHAIVVFALIHFSAVQRTPKIQPHVDLITTKLVFHPERPLPDGGGGGRMESPASKGLLPQRTPRPFVPPTTRPPDHEPALPMPPAILSPEQSAPVPTALIGDPGGIPGPPSDGQGKGPGIGNGKGKYGVGDGAEDGGISARSFTGVTRPAELLYKVEPEFTDEARKVRLQGTVVLIADIDEQGRAVNVRVRQGLGLGLDERAVEAVGKWRFRPATRDGRPVRAPALIEVSFRLL